MMLFVFSVVLICADALVPAENCDRKALLIYEELGCTPTYSNSSKCPTKYTCEGLEPSDKNCYFRGKSYNILEKVDSSFLTSQCMENCVCKVKDGRPTITCEEQVCSEGGKLPITKGCHSNYSLESCCPVGEICPSSGELETCTVGSRKYKEGEVFDVDDMCLECVCQKGFKLEAPFCRRRFCGDQINEETSVKVQQFCAAFYSREYGSYDRAFCCPDEWICPDGSEIIKGKTKSDDTCKFGNTTLKVGQYFMKKNFKSEDGVVYKRVICVCGIPPFVKCINIYLEI